MDSLSLKPTTASTPIPVRLFEATRFNCIDDDMKFDY